ncbi:hypothetical protein ACP70R_024571 [Stipagrostis hirtigluma subsp. patula]
MEPVLLHSSSLALLLLLLLLSSQGLCFTQGRTLHYQVDDPQPKLGEGAAMAEALIGSRPPRCEGKCAPCGRCEAVQVPVAPRVDRTDESFTNYKPLNWKCRCADRRALDP